MDPVTTVALAGNILQFLQFVGGLLYSTRKLHASATSTSSTNDHLQDICGTLLTFDTQLQRPLVPSTGQGNRPSKHDEPLAECAVACRRDCEDLLRIMNQLQTIATKGSRYWHSFRAALAEVWKQHEIEDLRSRIADRHRQMILLLCAASNESIRALDNHVKDVGRGIWTLGTDSRLDSILSEVRSLQDRVTGLYQNKPVTTDYINSICTGFSKLSLEAQDLKKEVQILSTINYSDRTARHQKIPVAHTRTFKWSLRETEETEVEYGKLRRWLKSDDALFWVSGKPGSGKSTFMKWIADSDETKKCLAVWAGKHEPLIVSHYFTIYGTPIQRSLEGLLRSLVFGILVRKPTLIPKLLVDRWERSFGQPQWTQSELEALLRRFGAEGESLPSKICYFIDGLDEYEGDHLDICQTLKQLSQSPSIKVCVSSRPWNVFEDALGDKPSSKLYMHRLTRGDIHDYTESRLQEHTRWNILQQEVGSVPSQSLINEVVDRSNGVFLWVTLVVSLLREGLTNDDSLFDLRRRLSSFPADLDDFFKHIIQSVDPFYTENMAATLSLALEAQGPLYLEIYSFHDLALADENYAFKEPVDLMDTDPVALGRLYNTVSRRINGRCKGLLERNGGRMEFLHRTVYDFLRTNEMSEFLRDQTKNRHSASLSILEAFVSWIKRLTFPCAKLGRCDPLSEMNDFVTVMKKGLQYARLAEIQGESSRALTAALLDNMEHSITRMLLRGQIEMADPSYARDIFRQLVLEAGVGAYMRNKLTADPKFLTNHYTDRFQSPLYLVLGSSCKLTTEDKCCILNGLLKGGHAPQPPSTSPQAIYTSDRIWRYLLVDCKPDDCTPIVLDSKVDWQWADRLLAYAENNILLALFKYGTSPNTTITIRFSPMFKYEIFKMPIWLVFVLAVSRAHSCKRPEAYEETLAAMLKLAGPLQKATVDTGSNFWDMCHRWFPLPRETNLCGDDFLVRIFTLVLSKIPADLEAFAKAQSWVKPVLSADANSKLAAAVASVQMETSLRSQETRPAEDQQEVSRKRKRGQTRTRRKKRIVCD
ncbi:hypothetical protein F5Y10DRAFT_271626 [Nemania abortiva]|nr:hypothetical protein F5Y10DRAFT_271626 [Nemania abortiva]